MSGGYNNNNNRLKSRNWERNNGSTRPSVKHEVLGHKNTKHRDGLQMQTVPTTWWGNRPYNISMPNTGKRTICKIAW